MNSTQVASFKTDLLYDLYAATLTAQHYNHREHTNIKIYILIRFLTLKFTTEEKII